jgi:membrane protein
VAVFDTFVRFAPGDVAGIALSVFTLISFALVMVGPALADQVASGLGLGPLFAWEWKVVQWPAAFALVATALWLLSSLGFRWYVIHFGNYQKTYGAIGDVIVALLWFYFSGLAVLLGAQLNATIRQASTDGNLSVKKPEVAA